MSESVERNATEENEQREFVKEFACKTLLNYYQVKREKPEINCKKKSTEYIDFKIKALQEKMRENNYYEENYYEVTLLINSLVGLLVFPQQLEFDKIKGMTDEDFKRKMPTLYKYVSVQDRSVFYDDYHDTKRGCKETESGYFASHVLRHLRNSLSHQNVMISPIKSIYKVNQKQPITKIVFEDRPYENGPVMFKMVISVENKFTNGKFINDLELILEEICNVLLEL